MIDLLMVFYLLGKATQVSNAESSESCVERIVESQIVFKE